MDELCIGCGRPTTVLLKNGIPFTVMPGQPLEHATTAPKGIELPFVFCGGCEVEAEAAQIVLQGGGEL